MEPPAFWRDLRKLFRRLSKATDDLYAIDLGDGTWAVSGGSLDETLRHSVRTQFRTLAERAAIAADLAGDGEPLHAWLNRLKQGAHYTPVETTTTMDEAAWSLEGGWIEHLPVASAECCAEFETEAFKQDHARHSQSAVSRSKLLTDDKIGGPKLAAWLAAEMEIRDHMTRNRLHVLSGLDRKTIAALLQGNRVRMNRIQKLTSGLSREGPAVTVAHIPID